MAKVSLDEIAEGLVLKHALNSKDAKAFVEELFSLINEGLSQDGIVKIKGLGTFKVIDVLPRESINVNTKERVLIEGHKKITFTADPMMRDLVNKPFAQFETVILNEGVSIEQMNYIPKQEAPEEDEDEENQNEVINESNETISLNETPEEEKQDKETPSIIEKTQDDKKESEAKTPNTLDEEKKAEQADQIKEEESSFTTQTIVTQEEKDASSSWVATHKGITIGAIAAVLIIGLIIGFSLSTNKEVKTQEKNKDITLVKKDSVKKLTVIKSEEEITPKQTQAPLPKELNDALYQVKTGAYNIVGTDKTIKVKPGETMTSIANQYLGNGMQCYIQVYNGILEVEDNQMLKIPKLEYTNAFKKLNGKKSSSKSSNKSYKKGKAKKSGKKRR